MCECNECCKPDKLRGKPEDCSPEQIAKCHGDAKVHPCVTESKVYEQKVEN